MRSSSHIVASLHKKKRKNLIWKCIMTVAIILFLCIALLIALHAKRFQIQQIQVVGNATVTTGAIRTIAAYDMLAYDGWVLPTNNTFFLRKKNIENDIVETIPTIASARVTRDGFNGIEISVDERQAANIWCSGTPAVSGLCFLMDANGFIFAPIGNASTTSMPVYFGIITQENPIGQTYLGPSTFEQVSNFFGALQGMNLEPQSFYASSTGEYEIDLEGGGTILTDTQIPFQTALLDLNAVIENGYLKTDSASLKTLGLVDLRYDNKVVFTPRAS